MEINHGFCGLCKKIIWFWQRGIYSEYDKYGDGKGFCHLKCHNKLKRI